MWAGSPTSRPNISPKGQQNQFLNRFFCSLQEQRHRSTAVNSTGNCQDGEHGDQVPSSIPNQNRISIAVSEANPINKVTAPTLSNTRIFKITSLYSSIEAAARIKKGMKESNENRKQKKEISENAAQKQDELAGLFFALKLLTRKERFKKAMRHFQDSLSLMPVRHDLELCESWVVLAMYHWQTGLMWGNLMFFVGLLFPLISLFEPANMHVKDYANNEQLLYCEFILLLCIWVDIIMECFHRFFDKEKTLSAHYFFNYKFSTRIFIGLLLFLDFLYFHSSFPTLTYRFSRYLRPFLVFYYSQELRRTLISIIKSMKQITQLIVFIFCLMFFFALISWRIIGDLDGAVPYDELSSNFSNLFSAASAFYVLISFDNFPDCMIPSYSANEYYSIFFIVYCVLIILLLIPIPVSIVYEAFRLHRSKLVLIDRITQREALMSCFISLDFNNAKQLDYAIFEEFMCMMYKNRKRLVKRIKQLYLHLDKNNSGSISMDEFFNIVDIIERFPKYQLPYMRNWPLWDRMREYLNYRRWGVKRIAKSQGFEVLVIALLLVNCSVLVIGMISENERTIEFTDSIDDLFFYLYLIEFLIKAVGIGIEKYFDDSWNCLDFFLLAITFLSIVLSTTLSIIQTAKSTKLIRLLRMNKILRVLRTLRSVKVFKLFFAGFELFYQVKLLVQKILMCLPIVMRLIPVNLMLFYLYTYFALENYNTDTSDYKKDSPYTQSYENFSGFSSSLLVFFQISLEASWSNYLYDIQYKFEERAITTAFFLSFDFINQFILLSLVKGIVWEVFTFVNEEIKKQEAATQLLSQKEEPVIKKIHQLNNILFTKPQQIQDEIKDNKSNQSDTSKNNDGIILNRKDSMASNSSAKKQATPVSPNYTYLTSDHHGIVQYEKILYSISCDLLLKKTPKDPMEKSTCEKQSVYSDFPVEDQCISERPSHAFIKESDTDIFGSISLPFSRVLVSPFQHSFEQKSNQTQEIFPGSNESFTSGDQKIIREESKSEQQKPLRLQKQLDTEQLMLRVDVKTHETGEGSPSRCPLLLLQHKYSSDSEQPRLQMQQIDTDLSIMKSEIQMKSETEISAQPRIHRPSRSFTIHKFKDTQSKKYQDETIANKIMKEQIHWLRKRIKPLSFLKQQQAAHKKSMKNSSQNNSMSADDALDFQQNYILSDDEDVMEQYAKQVHQYIQEDDDGDAIDVMSSAQDASESSLNFEYMMKKALLKSSNMDMIKKYEIEYFQAKYGSYFNKLHEVNLAPMLRYESFIIDNLQRILRHKAFDCQLFFEILHGVENNISNVILRKGSLVKFIFQDSLGNWTCLKTQNNKTYTCLLGNGPWSFYETVFQKNNSETQSNSRRLKKREEIFVCKDFLMTSKNNSITKNLIRDFYAQLRTCARCQNDEHEFLTIHPEHSIFDMFTTFQSIDNEADLKAELRNSQQKFNAKNKLNCGRDDNDGEYEDNQQEGEDGKRNSPQDVETSVLKKRRDSIPLFGRKIMVCFLSYIGESEQDEDHQKKVGLFDDLLEQNESEGSMQFIKKKTSTIKNLKMEDINQKQAKDKDKIGEQSTLPMAYVIEMITKIQDLLLLYADNFYLKFSELLYLRMLELQTIEPTLQENNNKNNSINLKNSNNPSHEKAVVIADTSPPQLDQQNQIANSSAHSQQHKSLFSKTSRK